MKRYDTLIFELSQEGRKGYSLPKSEVAITMDLDASLLRGNPTILPQVSELDCVRHYTNLSQLNFGVESGFYPLGSCTMKYNPKINDELATLDGFSSLHPLSDVQDAQGTLAIYYETGQMLSEICGLEEFSLNPFAGAQGELTGLMIIREYHAKQGDHKRSKILVPTSAHGTNPASAAVCGLEVVEVACNPDGTVNMASLKENLSDEVAGIMLTNPNTLGMYEKDILEIADLVHGCGGLLYYDGANLNALLGYARPGDMGFDVIHLNLHKTFSTPHGGGGPGSGPVGVNKRLQPFLPNPRVVKKEGRYQIEFEKNTIQISSFYGNMSVVIRAYVYLKTLGKEHLKDVARYAVLNANYIKQQLEDVYELPVKRHCKHEVVFNGLKDKSSGVTTLDVAKRLLDLGYHAPTIYFPLLIEQALMVEPTEVESLQTLDEFVTVMKKIAQEAKDDPMLLKSSPYNTPVRRLDEALAARKPIVKFQDMHRYE